MRGCYVYTGTAWESVNGRYYTVSRWIPIYAFDMDTLADLWDIADGGDAITPITTESGFWNWWKAQWLDFRSWLSTHGIGGSGTTVNPTVLPTVPPAIDGATGEETDVYKRQVGGGPPPRIGRPAHMPPDPSSGAEIPDSQPHAQSSPKHRLCLLYTSC